MAQDTLLGFPAHILPYRFLDSLRQGKHLPQRVEKIFRPADTFSELLVLKILDFNGAGKQAKRRRWRIKQACFEEGSQSAVVQYPLIGLSRRCIPSWVSRAHPSPARGMQHP